MPSDGRRSAKGSKREVRPGVWYIRVSSGYKKDGTQRRKRRTVHGTEIDADAAIVRLSEEMGVTLAVGDNMTLNWYFYTMFLPGRKATTTNANVKTYKTVYRCHIARDFGNADIASIRNTDVQRWINKLPAQSAPAYVKALRAIMNQAAFDHVINESPMERYTFKLPRGRDTKPLPVWGAEEVAQCLVRLKGDGLYPLWVCMVAGGLSRSEALALDWEDVEFTNVLDMAGNKTHTAVLTVDGACTSEDGMKEPKNARRLRRVPLSPLFAEALFECAGTGPICKSYHGTRLTPGYIPKKWKRLFRAENPNARRVEDRAAGVLFGLPFVELGRMRATYSTLMQSAGIDGTVINAMQGRAENSQVLYTNYLNPYDATFVASAHAMERKIVGG